MITRTPPHSMWFRWATPLLWNGEWRLTIPKREPVEMTDEERETFWAAFDLVGMDNLGEVHNG